MFAAVLAVLGAALIALGCAAPPQADADAAAPPAVFRAGAFAVDITPLQFPISMNGGMSDREALSAHDRLHARCLVLDDGKAKIVFAVIDSCMVPREVLDEAKRLAHEKTGIATDHMLMSATHTHTAPACAGVFQTDADPAYCEFLAGRIAAGVAQAQKNLTPAQVGWAVGRDDTQVFNRRWLLKEGKTYVNPFGQTTDRARMNPGYNNPDLLEPAGPVDPSIHMIAVRSPEGRPIALLANYSLHYVGGIPGASLSADYFAAFADRIGVLLDAADTPEGKPAFVGIMSNGSSGDINNVDFRQKEAPKREPYEQVQVVADSVAQAAHAAYQSIQWHDHVTLAARETEIELGVRLPGASDVAEATAILAQAKGPSLKGLQEIYARETVLLADYPKTVKLKLQALRIGDIGIAAIPCEVFVQIGLSIREQSLLKPTFTISLANGYNGYLPTPAQHALGGYETWRARSSYLEVDASPKIEHAMLELLRAVAE